MLVDNPLHLGDIDVALERIRRAGGVKSRVDHAVLRNGADQFSVAMEGVKMHISQCVFAGLRVILRHNIIGGAALMGGLYMRHTKHIASGSLQLVKALTAGIAFVAEHHGGPLFGTHGGRA